MDDDQQNWGGGDAKISVSFKIAGEHFFFFSYEMQASI